MHIEISREDVLLDTGGGLKKAEHFFLDSIGRSEEPFLLHNVDVISNIDFSAMLTFHYASSALATLAVQDRPASRYLLFDERGQLCGRRQGVEGKPELVCSASTTRALGFSGIHIISPRIFSLINEKGIFSIIPVYLRVAALGERILAFPADRYYWRDLGRPEHIDAAAQDMREGRYTPEPDAFISH
jgi:NDP-sugar pyrophosphorylase family protein